jgi:hypothetical protein
VLLTLNGLRPTWSTSLEQRQASPFETGNGPPLTAQTPIEIVAIASQSMADGHSPRTGIPMTAVMAGVRVSDNKGGTGGGAEKPHHPRALQRNMGGPICRTSDILIPTVVKKGVG